jgi:hypothetical protein
LRTRSARGLILLAVSEPVDPVRRTWRIAAPG